MMEYTVQGDPGGSGYGWAKKTLVPYTAQMALHLSGRSIRINCIHPMSCNATCATSSTGRCARPDLKAPTREDCEPVFQQFQAMPIPYVQPADIANLAVFLASDEARYITGQ